LKIKKKQKISKIKNKNQKSKSSSSSSEDSPQKSIEAPKHVEIQKPPVEVQKPIEVQKPVEVQKSIEVPKPVEIPKPVEVPQPVEVPKPVEVKQEIKPVEAKPVKSIKPVEAKPVEVLSLHKNELKPVIIKQEVQEIKPIASPEDVVQFWKAKDSHSDGQSKTFDAQNVSKAQSIREKLAAVVRRGQEEEAKRNELENQRASQLGIKRTLSIGSPKKLAIDPEELARRERIRIEAEEKRERERLEFEQWENDRKKREMGLLVEPPDTSSNLKPSEVFGKVPEKKRESIAPTVTVNAPVAVLDPDEDEVLAEIARREEQRLNRVFSSRK